MMDLPADKLPPSAGVFDFSFAQKVNAGWPQGWTPNP